VLVVMSGVPGVGKSAFADALGRHLGAPVMSVDPIEAAIWRGGIEPSFATGVAAYEVAATLARHQLALGMPVIGDAVNAVEVARQSWRRAARSAGVPWRVVEVACSDVDAHRRRLAERRRRLPDALEPTWEEVERRMDEFEPWPEPTLRVDSAGGFDANLRRIIAYVTDDPVGGPEV
jgi:predicted kinase